jgi:hypothetical protein
MSEEEKSKALKVIFKTMAACLGKHRTFCNAGYDSAAVILHEVMTDNGEAVELIDVKHFVYAERSLAS